MKGRLLFQEEQSFKNTWVWWLVVAICTGAAVLFSYGFYHQFILRKPWGGHPLGDTGLMIAGAGMFLLMGILIWLFRVMHLTVKIDKGAVMYSFPPFVSEIKNVRKQHLKEVYVRKHTPAAYGGYGYRVRFDGGKAYTIGGRSALQLVFKDGKKLLLGTRKPVELQAAIKKLKQNWGMH